MIKDDKKLNITMISDSFYPVLGGRESAVDNLCKELNKEHNLTLATGNISPKHKTIQDFEFGYAILRSKCLKFRKYEYLCFANKKFRKIIENNQIDIIHTQTKYGLCNYGIKLAKKKNIPVITTAHTNYPEVYKKSIKCGLIRHFAIKRVVKIINKMDAVITVSKHMAKVLEKIGCKTKIKVIPNGTDIIYPEKPQELINKVNDLYNLKNEENVFLVVGYVSEVKNISFLLESLSILKKKLSNFKCVFAGLGNLDYYRKKAKSLKIENNCDFIGKVSEREILGGLFLRSDILLFPSITDTFGLVLREAAVMKTPTLVIENQATSEDIVDNVNGFISPLCSKKYAEKIYNAITNKQNLIKVGEQASKTLPKTWNEIADRTADFYKEIIAEFKK